MRLSVRMFRVGKAQHSSYQKDLDPDPLSHYWMTRIQVSPPTSGKLTGGCSLSSSDLLTVGGVVNFDYIA
jgi:hypothetical protein